MASNAFHAAVILAPDSPRALVVTDLDLIRAALSGGPEQTAAEIAREPMATIGPSAPLQDAVALMARRDLAHVLVAEPKADWPAGVLSSFDVASVLAGRDPALTRVIRPGPARPLVSAIVRRRPGSSARSPPTNSCESMIETVRRTSRNVKRWQSGGMCLRWTAAGTLEGERRFRKIIGHADLAKLAIAVERELAARRAANHRHTPVATAAPEVAASPA